MEEQNIASELGATDWSALATLHKKEKKKEPYRPFPAFSFASKITSIVVFALEEACLVDLLVLAFVFGFIGHPNFDFDRGYGIVGFLAFLFALIVCGLQILFGFLYDHKVLNKEKDEAKLKKGYSFVDLSRDIAWLPILLAFLAIPLRSEVLQIREVSFLLVLLLPLGYALLLLLPFLYRKKEFYGKRVLSALISSLIPALFLCYTAILAKPYSMTNVRSIFLLIFSFLSYLFSTLLSTGDHKGAGYHIASELFRGTSYILVLTDLLCYGMIYSSQL